MPETIDDIVSPFNTKHPIYLQNIFYKTPLNYIYCKCFWTKVKKTAKIAGEDIQQLLGHNKQLKDIQVSEDELKSIMYNMFTFMYCAYEDFRNTINNTLDLNICTPVFITNDTFFGIPGSNYWRYLRKFAKLVKRPSETISGNVSAITIQELLTNGKS